MARNGVAEALLKPYVVIGLSIPSLAWAVIAVIWLGISDLAPIFTIVVVLTPIITSNVWEGAKAVDCGLLEMAAVYRAPPLLTVREIILPQLVPYLVSAARYGFSLAWKVVVIAEMLGVNNGVGFAINYAFNQFSMRGVLAWTAAFTALMAVIEYLIGLGENWLLRWRPGSRWSEAQQW
jgi:NitT/TauT family transport system permease protein